ncbi:MAG: GNAT family N-acetyltransferase [Cyanobacteria bacterium P01_H01_bin.15]
MELKTYSDNLARFGFWKTAHTVLHAAINKLIFFKTLQGMTLTMQSLDDEYLKLDPRFESRFLSSDELLAYVKDESFDMDEHFIKSAIARKDTCFGIIESGQLVSYGWYSTIPTPMSDDLQLYFDENWTYMYKGYTKPSHRGLRLHALGMALAVEAFAAKGAKGLISYVETYNYRSLRSCERMGYRNFGKIYIARLFGKYRIYSQKECTPYGFTVRELPSGDVHTPTSAYPEKQGP